jgi:hypothetical protein
MSLIPIIYICFGDIPDYLAVNIEISSRHNPVIVLSNKTATEMPSEFKSSNKNVQYESFNNYMTGAYQYAPHYRHLVCEISMSNLTIHAV